MVNNYFDGRIPEGMMTMDTKQAPTALELINSVLTLIDGSMQSAARADIDPVYLTKEHS